jgi:hypothetical protein
LGTSLEQLGGALEGLGAALERWAASKEERTTKGTKDTKGAGGSGHECGMSSGVPAQIFTEDRQVRMIIVESWSYEKSWSLRSCARLGEDYT